KRQAKARRDPNARKGLPIDRRLSGQIAQPSESEELTASNPLSGPRKVSAPHRQRRRGPVRPSPDVDRFDRVAAMHTLRDGRPIPPEALPTPPQAFLDAAIDVGAPQLRKRRGKTRHQRLEAEAVPQRCRVPVPTPGLHDKADKEYRLQG